MRKGDFRNHVSILRTTVAALLFVCISAGSSAADGGLEKIADNVYSYVAVRNASPRNSFGANAGIIIGRDGVVVIDTLISAREAQRFIRDIRSVTDKPVRYVVNTHSHLDHTFGNAEFGRLGAVIISHSRDAAQMKASGRAVLENAGAYGLTEKDMEGTRLAFPSLTFDERMEIDLGDERVELIYPGPSHTAGSIAVFLPGKKVLFAGDILFTDYHPFIADGDVDGWVGALDRILAMDVTEIVPGHGPVSGKKDVRDMRDYLVAFDKKAKALCSKSEDPDWIASEIRKVLPHRPEGEGMIPANIRMRYLKKSPDSGR